MSHILVIEDNQANADMIIHILQASGWEVKHFIRGLEGAKSARSERPDLILMDFNLPDIDGQSLVLSLRRQLGGQASPPIIACTARVGSHVSMLAKRFGCAAFLAKPFTPEQLLDVVKTHLPTSEGA